MSGHGPVGAVGAGNPTSRAAGHSDGHCFEPGKSQANAGVRGGGPAAPAHSASLLHSRPDCLPAGVTRGGGPPVDPAVAALATLLSASAPTHAARNSSMRQLAQMLSSGLDRIANLVGTMRERVAGPPVAALPAEVADQFQLQQRPPIASMYLVDLQTGRYVSGLPHDPAAAGGHTDPTAPTTSWLPVTGPSWRDPNARLVERLDGVLAEFGITRLQLVLLTVVAPLATAFLIDVVSRIAN